MRYLGIDFGSKRVGIAVSDEAEGLAFPVSVLSNTDKLLEEVVALCTEHGVGAVVVGESKDFNMNENEIMKEVHPFIQKLKEVTHLPVFIHPEFLTSLEAKQIQGKNDMLDASAAALILQSYLDTKKNTEYSN